MPTTNIGHHTALPVQVPTGSPQKQRPKFNTPPVPSMCCSRASTQSLMGGVGTDSSEGSETVASSNSNHGNLQREPRSEDATTPDCFTAGRN